MLGYPVTLHKDPDTKSIVVSFVDISFCHSVGDTEEAALRNAVDALITSFQAFEDKREMIPEPSAASAKQHIVWLPALIASKALLYNAMLESGKRKADLARTLRISPPLVDRLMSMRHKSRIDQIETALAALGKRLVVQTCASSSI